MKTQSNNIESVLNSDNRIPIMLWLACLPKHLVDKALKNHLNNYMTHDGERVDFIPAGLDQNSTEALFWAFSWGMSPEGFSFWSSNVRKVALD